MGAGLGPFPPKGARTEAQWRNRIVNSWYGRQTAPSLHDRRWHQWLECATPAGWPDLFWAKPGEGAGAVEFKFVRGTDPLRVSLGFTSPAQPLVLRWMAGQTFRAGVLAWVEVRQQWLWVPAQQAHRWALNVQGPNGFLMWPHTWGIGAVPRPWQLPTCKRLTPYPLTSRNPEVHYMVDGAEVTARAFDTASVVPMDYRTMRRADAVLESVATTMRKSINGKLGKARAAKKST